MSYFSQSHTHMPSCPPLTGCRVGQITSCAKMGVTYRLQKICGNVVMQSSQSQAFCGVVLLFTEHSNSLVFAIASLPLGLVLDTHFVHPFLSSQDIWDSKA